MDEKRAYQRPEDQDVFPEEPEGMEAGEEEFDSRDADSRAFSEEDSRDYDSGDAAEEDEQDADGWNNQDAGDQDAEEAEEAPEEDAPQSGTEAPREDKGHAEPRRYSRDISPFLLAQVKNENTRDFIENRLIPQMNWYSAKSAEYNCMTAAIALGALIPVVSVLANGSTFIKVLIALLGAGVTAVNAYLSMQNYKDLWLTYRGTRENLLRTLYCYFNNAGMFSRNLPELEKDILLVNLCEEELSRENGGWVGMMQGADSFLKNLSL